MHSSVDSHYRLWLRSIGEKYTHTVHSLLLLLLLFLLLPLCLFPAPDPTHWAFAPDHAPPDAPALAPAHPAPPAPVFAPASAPVLFLATPATDALVAPPPPTPLSPTSKVSQHNYCYCRFIPRYH